MSKLTGAEIVVECLKEQGVDTVFGYPGGAILNIYDALYQHQDEITHILTSHEQGASHAADGYARATGRVGVCLATSGPGATNLVTGIATANYDSVPLVCFTGQVPTSLIGNDAFQEVDITGITRSICKYAVTVRTRESLGEIIKKAFHIATTGRPGPVLVDLPKDIQREYGSSCYPDQVKIRGYRPGFAVHGGQIKKALERLNQAKRPVFLVGGGVNIARAEEAMTRLAERTGVPVVTTGAGNPGKYIPAWKAAGIKVIPVVAAAVLAKHLEPLGIDAVIAEGTESGGHVGEMATMALVPQVVDAVNVPVIAAGGIADGRQLAAALALGACGVQVGTCLLVSEECPIHENYKAALLKAKDSDTIVTGRSVGAPVRVLKNRMSREYVRQENAGADKMELEKYTLGSLRRAVFEGDTTTGSLMAGQVAGMLHEVRPVADILADLWNGGRQRIAALSTEC